MERRTKKMLLAILMILSVLATDFFVLGSGIMTYASQFNSETNNANVEFSVYFKDNDNRIDSIEKSIKSEDVKLYAEIKVKNEGYLKEGTVIELENSNFDLKNDILSSNKHINSIDGNKVSLKQIGVGETVEIELGIKLAITDKITTDYLSKTSKVKMIGSYVYSKAEEGQSIRADKVVSVNYVPDESIGTELETDVITNKVMAANGENKRIVQLLVKSRITNNEYPVKETKLTATIPQLSEEIPEISAIAVNELATNGKTEIDKLITENGLVEITLNNETSWMKNACDEIVITYIYPETVDASKIEITTNSEITLYDSNETVLKAESKEISENEELNNSIIGRIENTTKELYKGKLYANLDLTYNTETKIAITNANIVENVVVQEENDEFGVAEKELLADTKYITTEINVREMLEILGQEGSIEIKNGETSYVINKETEIDENGKAKINYKNAASKLEIKTSNPEKAGIIKLKHTKTMTGKGYTREQLQEVQNLKTKLSIEGIAKTTEKGVLELKETKSKAELTIENNKTALSTTEPNDIILGITLNTNGEQYDLYKNPKISLKFPVAVEKVELMSIPSKQNAEEFTVNVGQFDAKNKTMLIELDGEQTAYPKSQLTQSYIQLNLKITLDSLALAQDDKIMMAYTNENATQYQNEINGVGVAEQTVKISAPSQLIKMFNINTNENTSLTETILQEVKEKDEGKTVDFGISLINNKDSDISNLKILGKLPTTENAIAGQKENTLETTLKNITASNATIYYTENASATPDIENTANGWTKDLSTLTNTKLYLIELDTLERGASYTANITAQIPKTISENELSYTQYGVIYDTDTETSIKESSRKIGLASTVAANINTKITAQVGNDILEDGDAVKEGEVIKYTIELQNQGTSTLENVQVKLDVPEGTTYVRPTYLSVINSYYEEVVDEEILSQLTNLTIEQLTSTPYVIEYEVRVNKGTKNKEISNSLEITYNESTVKVDGIKNKIEESNIRVTAKRQTERGVQLLPGKNFEYIIYVENLSKETIKNIKLNVIAEGFDIETINDSKDINIIEINEIETKSDNEEANTMDGIGIRSFILKGKIKEDANQVNIYATAKDSENRDARSNMFSENIPYLNIEADMTSSQNNKYIKEGDTVKYNIAVKNLGTVEVNARIKDEVPDILEIQSILENNEINVSTTESATTNVLDRIVQLKPQEQINIDIIAKVRTYEDIYNGVVITNSAKVEVIDSISANTPVISHILRKNTTDSDIENIISGYVWYDANLNGRKDATEEFLSNINVKLYDVKTDNYVIDNEGTQIQTLTNDKGEYTINKVKEGSYLLIFDYDTEKYEPTKLTVEGVNTSLNSKAILKYIKENGEKQIITVIKVDNLTENIFNMNIGLKDNTGESIPEELPEEPEPETPDEPIQPETPDEPIQPEEPEEPDIPTEPENPDTPTQPEEPDIPTEPENPDVPTEPEEPDTPIEPEQTIDTKTISGFAWLDLNENSKKDIGETYLPGIKVILYDVYSKDYLKDENGNIIEVITDNNGKYGFNNIEKGQYVVIFEYNTEQYKVIANNSNIISRIIEINGEEIKVALTGTIIVQDDIFNLNIGLKENLKFDLELNKYISKIVVQTDKATKTYDYEGKTLGKVEIHRKQIQGALVVLEYAIKVKNTGEIAGYAKNIVDYLPSGLTFSSELNTDWYLSGNYLYTKSLENIELNSGEEKEIKLILTKTMTNENVGLINNTAEIYKDYNQLGEPDIDSMPNNQAQNEDDFGTTDVIIQVATGGSIMAYIILAIINIVLIFIAIKIMLVNDIIQITTKKGRG